MKRSVRSASRSLVLLAVYARCIFDQFNLPRAELFWLRQRWFLADCPGGHLGWFRFRLAEARWYASIVAEARRG